MTSADMIPAAVLKRKAVVYARQSTQSQVMTNLESQRRQYDLVEVARQWGFADVEVIDEDLGRSARAMVRSWSAGSPRTISPPTAPQPKPSTESCIPVRPKTRSCIAVPPTACTIL
jgi:hypothetical protein